MFLSKQLRGDRQEKTLCDCKLLRGSVPHVNRAVNHWQWLSYALSIPCSRHDSSQCEVGGSDLVWPLIKPQKPHAIFFTDWNTKWVKAVLGHRCNKGWFLQCAKAMLFIYYFIYLFFLSNQITSGNHEDKVRASLQKSGRGLVHISQSADWVMISLSLFQTQIWCFPFCIVFIYALIHCSQSSTGGL